MDGVNFNRIGTAACVAAGTVAHVGAQTVKSGASGVKKVARVAFNAGCGIVNFAGCVAKHTIGGALIGGALGYLAFPPILYKIEKHSADLYIMENLDNREGIMPSQFGLGVGAALGLCLGTIKAMSRAIS